MFFVRKRLQLSNFFVLLQDYQTIRIEMEPTEQTLVQVERIVRKIAEKFPSSEDASVLTDIHICVSQENGEVMVYDDDDKEITRSVVEQWINAADDDFYEQVAAIFRKVLGEHTGLIDKMSVMKPYAFVLESDDRDEQHELYVVDDETMIIDPIVMKDLSEDLDSFFETLMKDV